MVNLCKILSKIDADCIKRLPEQRFARGNRIHYVYDLQRTADNGPISLKYICFLNKNF